MTNQKWQKTTPICCLIRYKSVLLLSGVCALRNKQQWPIDFAIKWQTIRVFSHISDVVLLCICDGKTTFKWRLVFHSAGKQKSIKIRQINHIESRFGNANM
jgi:hypothetical protein